MLPFALGSSITSATAGFAVLGDYRPVLWFSFVRASPPWSAAHTGWLMELRQAVMAVGYGLMIMLSNTSSTCVPWVFLFYFDFDFDSIT